jgi:SUN domain-containing protein 1/2
MSGLPGPPRSRGRPRGSGKTSIAANAGSESDTSRATGRAKSPIEQLAELARQFSPTRILMREKSGEPENQYQSMVMPEPHVGNGHDSSKDNYNYEEEERNVAAQEGSRHQRRKSQLNYDNKAYRPGHEEVESSEGSEDEHGKKRRRSKKHAVGNKGLDGSLPVITATHKKKKPARHRKTNTATSINLQPDESDTASAVHSVEHEPVEDHPTEDSYIGDTSADYANGIPDPLPEEDPSSLQREIAPPRRRVSPTAFFSSIANFFRRTIAAVLFIILRFFALLAILITRTVGFIARPFSQLGHALSRINFYSLGQFIIIVAIAVLAIRWVAAPTSSIVDTPPAPRRNGIWSSILGSYRGSRSYVPPAIPAGSVQELVDRLAGLEAAFADLSENHKRAITKAENDLRVREAVSNRLVNLEGKLDEETRRASRAEEVYRSAAVKGIDTLNTGFGSMKGELEALKELAGKGGPDTSALVTEVKSTIANLEERLAHAEGSVKEVLSSAKSSSDKSGSSLGWWTKHSHDGKPLTIRSSDGRDVTHILASIVESSVLRYSKDGVARPDFALHSGGGRIIPTMTSQTYQIRPRGIPAVLWGSLTGQGYAEGRPPVNALIPDIHVGNCWPFAGHKGQLGVMLSRSIYPDAITIDHASKDVAIEVTQAPRDMKVWGMVEGNANIEKMNAYLAEHQAKVDAGEADELERFSGFGGSYDSHAHYLKLAAFAYDPNAPAHTQTFPVFDHIRTLGIDIGIVIFEVESNWGNPDYTCIYRVRVHGTDANQQPSVQAT